MTKITNVITLAKYADEYGLDVKRLRRLARKNEWPTTDNVPFKFGSVWAIDATAPAVELPDKSARGARRADGRQRFVIYVNNSELTAVNAMGIETVNPRVASKLRRDARKLATPFAELPEPDRAPATATVETAIAAAGIINKMGNDADNTERVAEQMFNDARERDDNG